MYSSLCFWVKLARKCYYAIQSIPVLCVCPQTNLPAWATGHVSAPFNLFAFRNEELYLLRVPRKTNWSVKYLRKAFLKVARAAWGVCAQPAQLSLRWVTQGKEQPWNGSQEDPLGITSYHIACKEMHISAKKVRLRACLCARKALTSLKAWHLNEHAFKLADICTNPAETIRSQLPFPPQPTSAGPGFPSCTAQLHSMLGNYTLLLTYREGGIQKINK